MIDPLPGHVHPSATAYRAGCRCQKCRAHIKAKRIQLERHGPNLVDANPVRDNVCALIGEGFSRSQIAAVAGVTTSLVTSLHSDRPRRLARVQRASAAPLLAVSRHDLYARAADTSMVPAVGAHRRVQALQRFGWELMPIAQTQARYWNLQKFLWEQRDRMEARLYRFIAARYEALWDVPGGSRRAIGRAVKLEWAPPMAWDDIDDPDAQPDFGGESDSEALRRALHEQGLPDAELAAEVGITPDAARVWRRRRGLSINRRYQRRSA